MEEFPEIVILGATIGSRRDRENEQEEVELNGGKRNKQVGNKTDWENFINCTP